MTANLPAKVSSPSPLVIVEPSIDNLFCFIRLHLDLGKVDGLELRRGSYHKSKEYPLLSETMREILPLLFEIPGVEKVYVYSYSFAAQRAATYRFEVIIPGIVKALLALDLETAEGEHISEDRILYRSYKPAVSLVDASLFPTNCMITRVMNREVNQS